MFSYNTWCHCTISAYYVSLEASGHANKVGKLDSKEFSGGDYCVEFYYHMFGAGINNLYLNVVSGTHTYRLKTWSGDHGDHWVHQRMNAHVHTSGTFKV